MVPVCVTVQRTGVSGAVYDTQISGSATDAPGNSGSIPVMNVGSLRNTPRQSLVKADLPALPAGASLSSATLTITPWWADNAAATMNAHNVLEAWSESVVDWAIFYANGAAAAYNPAVVASAKVNGAHAMSFNLTALAAAWYAGTTPNNGVLLEEAGTGDSIMNSSEDATVSQRPLLTVCYLPVPTCTDGVKNGTETGVDCGGGTCPACAVGSGCALGSDCVSLSCHAGSCVAPSCTDGIKNGTETAVDCGGGTCPACVVGSGCALGSDCVSLSCHAGSCAAPSCTDGVKNGAETGVDCGGGTCSACAVGSGCALGSDCVSLSCPAGSCAAPSCTDGIKNGTESAVDCGGSCAPCATGQACVVSGDCVSAACFKGACVQLGPSPAAGPLNIQCADVTTGVADAITEEAPTRANATGPVFSAGYSGDTPGTLADRTLLSFDLSQVQGLSDRGQLVSAVARLHLTSISGSSTAGLEVHRMLSAWTSSTTYQDVANMGATNGFDPASKTPLTVSRPPGSSTSGPEFQVSGPAATVTVDLGSVVDDWLVNPASDFGLILTEGQQIANSVATFDSFSATDPTVRPTLHVCYVSNQGSSLASSPLLPGGARAGLLSSGTARGYVPVNNVAIPACHSGQPGAGGVQFFVCGDDVPDINPATGQEVYCWENIAGTCYQRVVRPVAPISGSTVLTQTPRLEWDEYPDQDTSEIRVCSKPFANCPAPEYDVILSSGNPTRWVPPQPLAPGTWFWEVTAYSQGAVEGVSASWEFEVETQNSATLDSSWGSLPDFDGDGYIDVAATGADGAYVYLGHAPTAVQFQMASEATTVGDINGDGFSDLALAGEGKILFAMGGASPFVQLQAASDPNPVNGLTYGTPRAAGDLNRDGFADVVVSVHSNNQVVPNEPVDQIGTVYVYLGRPDGPDFTTPSITLHPPAQAGSLFGSAAASAGDLNGDGFADLVVGAGSIYDWEESSAYVYLGGPGGVPTTATQALTDGALDSFGFSVAAAGDMNGDGYCDLVVGAPQAGAEGPDGAVVLFAGGPGIGFVTAAFATQSGTAPGHQLGVEVAGLGTINNDTFGAVAAADSAGTVEIYAGTAGSLNPAGGFTLPSAGLVARLGYYDRHTSGDVFFAIGYSPGQIEVLQFEPVVGDVPNSMLVSDIVNPGDLLFPLTIGSGG